MPEFDVVVGLAMYQVVVSADYQVVVVPPSAVYHVPDPVAIVPTRVHAVAAIRPFLVPVLNDLLPLVAAVFLVPTPSFVSFPLPFVVLVFFPKRKSINKD
jgi:hypothetical protein